MRLQITGDFAAESGLEEVILTLTRTSYFKYFQEKSYGEGLLGFSVILMCQEPSLGLKQRIKHSKAEKKIYMDIMLDLNEYKNATPSWRLENVLDRIFKEAPGVISKYKLEAFNAELFLNDASQYFRSKLS